MPIDFRCSHCFKRLRVPDGSLGKKSKCPHCHGVTKITEQVAAAGLDGSVPAEASVAPLATAPPTADVNPYQAPNLPADVAAAAIAATREDVLAKVKLPAIVMLAHAALMALLTLLSIGVAVATDARGFGPPPATEAQRTVQIVWSIVGNLLSAVVSVIIAVGARKMMRLESRGWSMTAAIASIVPCFGCCLVGMPAGIWAMTVLGEKDVKAWLQLANHRQT